MPGATVTKKHFKNKANEAYDKIYSSYPRRLPAQTGGEFCGEMKERIRADILPRITPEDRSLLAVINAIWYRLKV